ncbi:MAG: hypothetical protein AAFT19_11740, partial [Pseudomonadota bacterium]
MRLNDVHAGGAPGGKSRRAWTVVVRALCAVALLWAGLAGLPAEAQLAPPPTDDEIAPAAAPTGIVVRGNRRIEVETIIAYTDLDTGDVITAEDVN